MEDKKEKRMQEIEAKNPKLRFEIMHISEILGIKFPDKEWLIDKLIPTECITILSGAPASYKTWLLLRMAVDIAKGGKFLDRFECKKSGVLIINEEDHIRLLQDRLKLLQAGEDLEINIISQANFAVLEEGDLNKIIEICQEKKADIIFIDSLVRISDNDENDSKQMSRVFKNIKRFCQAGKTVIITHHERKESSYGKPSAQNRLRGSSDISASIDSHLAIQKDKNDKTKLKFEQAKNRFSQEINPFIVRVVNENEKVSFKIEDGFFDEKEADIHEAIIEIINIEKEGILKKEIIEKVMIGISVSENKVKRILRNMIEDGEVITKSGKKNEKICFLAEIEKDDQPP